MTLETELTVIGFWAAYGMVGQLGRGLFGLYKKRQAKGKEWKPDKILFGLSIASGALIGVMGGVIGSEIVPEWVNPATLVLLGFAGVDVFESLLKNRMQSIGIIKKED